MTALHCFLSVDDRAIVADSMVSLEGLDYVMQKIK